MLQEKSLDVEVSSKVTGERKRRELQKAASVCREIAQTARAASPQPRSDRGARQLWDGCGMAPEKSKPGTESKKRDSEAVPRPRSQSQGGEEVSLIGRIGRYPEVKRTQRGVLLATFSVGSERSYKDAAGQWQKKIVWQRIVVWGEFAQSLSKRLQSGAQVYVEGKLTMREWTDRQNNKRTSTDLVADDVRFMDMAENGIVHQP